MGTSVKPNGPNGMASAAAALRYWERRQEVVSNNIANVSTDGYKGQRVFARMVEGALPVAESSTDFTPGAIQQTGNPYDVALEGKNFMVVQTPNGQERLSRGGTLHVDEQGTLVDSSGNAVLGDRGVIHVGQRGNNDVGPITIGRTGVVKAGNTDLGQLRLETVQPGTQLTREGGLFVPPSQRSRLSPDSAVVLQGSREESNVTPVSEMVDMIAIQRAYTSVQKAMTTLDATRGIATTELGRPAN